MVSVSLLKAWVSDWSFYGRHTNYLKITAGSWSGNEIRNWTGSEAESRTGSTNLKNIVCIKLACHAIFILFFSLFDFFNFSKFRLNQANIYEHKIFTFNQSNFKGAPVLFSIFKDVSPISEFRFFRLIG